MKIKNLINFKVKGFNKNKLIALFLSGFIIFILKYHINSLGYVSYFSLLFIFFCTLLKSILFVIIENISKINCTAKNNNVLLIDKNKNKYDN